MLAREPGLSTVLSIAGTDPSGGAGIQADIKAISATGSYAATVITALVAQNTQGVRAIHEIPAAFVQEQLDAISSDLSVSAIKVGMLHKEEIIHVVQGNLEAYKSRSPLNSELVMENNTLPTQQDKRLDTPHSDRFATMRVGSPNIVLDPVISAQSGDLLLQVGAVTALTRLFPLCTLITPNIPEAEILLKQNIDTSQHMQSAAERLAHSHQVSVLLKGGHLTGRRVMDVFYDYSQRKSYCLGRPRIDTPHTHGTGCTLSSAIASYLAQGHTLYESIVRAKNYLYKAIEAGQYLNIGQGHGPVHHFYPTHRE